MMLFTRRPRLCAVVLLALGLLRGAAPAAAQSSCNLPAPATGDPRFHGRLADPRIAYMTQGPYICRWHLERRDPSAVSDVVHPVTFLIDEGVPKAWYPAIKAAVHEWLPVFDSLGFRHALVVRPATDQDLDAPPKNVVHLVNEPLGSPMIMMTTCAGVAATGQLVSCDIKLNNGAVFGPEGRRMCPFQPGSDPAVPVPCPDSVLLQFVRYMVTHEVGHTLGLEHNFTAATVYPTDSLRRPTFVRRMGSVASVMAYSQYNMLAQPEDRVPLADRFPHVGPYDRFAIAFAYRPIPGALTPEAELQTLERWRAVQDTVAYLRTGAETYDPAVGTGDNPALAVELVSRNRVRAWRRFFARDTAAGLRYVAEIGMPQFWQTRFMNGAGVLGATRPQAPYPRDPQAVRSAPVASALQLRMLRLVLAYVVYGQDPFLRLVDSVAGHGTPRYRAARADSVPFLFDTAATSSTPAAGGFPAAAAWHDAQQVIVATLVQAVPKMPADVLPAACRNLADAARALAKFEAGAAPGPRASAAALRTLLTRPDGCPAITAGD